MADKVDYESCARLYSQGRELSIGDLTLWRDEVAAFVHPGSGAVVDLGAGTGIFTRAWGSWGAGCVVAVEPAAAMRAEARRRGLPGNAMMVAGRAEQIPLTAGFSDVVWVSAVVHHLSDLDAWAVEVRRVLKSGGWLLLRGLFADLGTTSWLPELPGADRARRVFPSIRSLSERLGAQGIELVQATEVAESHQHRSARATAEWISKMRSADSLLLAFTDAEIDQGLERLASYPEGHVLGPTLLGFAAFRAVA